MIIKSRIIKDEWKYEVFFYGVNNRIDYKLLIFFFDLF